MHTDAASGTARALPPAPAAPPRPRLAAVPASEPAPVPAGSLPGAWVAQDDVTVGGLTIDRVLVGPNGVFAVHVDPDPRPVVVRAGYGIVRSGTRVPDGVKRAMFGAAALRAHLAGIGGDLFPYPVLVTAAPGEAGRRLGRLLVVRPERLAEAIWEHPARPLRRSVRVEVLEALR